LIYWAALAGEAKLELCLFLIKHHSTKTNRANSLFISEARSWTPKESRFDSWHRFFLFPKASRPALWPTQSFSVGATALSFRAGRSGCEADHSPPSGADVRNEWSYTFTSPTRFHGVHRVHVQFVINICGRKSWENVGKACGRIQRGENARTIAHGVQLFEDGSCKSRNEKTTRRTAQLSRSDRCLCCCCACSTFILALLALLRVF